MKEALKSLLDAATAGTEITETSGPQFPTRNGLVQVSAREVADALEMIATAEAMEFIALVQHVAGELIELSVTRKRAAEKLKREKLIEELSRQS
jgi:2-C-methyl-D-erythritol 4-phosphate cytidylyltransferase